MGAEKEDGVKREITKDVRIAPGIHATLRTSGEAVYVSDMSRGSVVVSAVDLLGILALFDDEVLLRACIGAPLAVRRAFAEAQIERIKDDLRNLK